MLFKSGGKGKTLCDILQILTAFESKKLIGPFVLAALMQVCIHRIVRFYLLGIMSNGGNSPVYLAGFYLRFIKNNGQYFTVYIPVGSSDAVYFGRFFDAFFAHAAVAEHFEFGGHGCSVGAQAGLGLGSVARRAEVEKGNDADEKYGFHDVRFLMMVENEIFCQP